MYAKNIIFLKCKYPIYYRIMIDILTLITNVYLITKKSVVLQEIFKLM